MIMRLRLTLAGSLIGGFMIWACGGEETTTSPGGVATQLAFTVEPTPTIVASLIVPALKVAIQGAFGFLVAGATDDLGGLVVPSEVFHEGITAA